MINKTILHFIMMIAVGIISFGLGLTVGNANIQSNNELATEIASIKMLKDLPVGGSIEIKLEEGTKPAKIYSEGAKVDVEANKTYGTILSIFGGLSATEVAAKDMGLEVKEGGLDVTGGQVKGYGILEQLWERIKSLFWFGSFILLALFVMTFIPATSQIAGTILRGLASVIPVLGSIVERIFAGLKWKKPLKQTVSGGQQFKANIESHPGLSDNEKDDVLKIFREAMGNKQDEDTKREIKNIKLENNI